MTRLRIILALATFLFLDVFVPAHTRGMLTLPGTKNSCCAAPVKSCCTPASENSSSHDQPTQDQRNHCAVCYVVALFTVPPVCMFDARDCDRLAEFVRIVLSQRSRLDFGFPYYSCGPPAYVA